MKKQKMMTKKKQKEKLPKGRKDRTKEEAYGVLGRRRRR